MHSLIKGATPSHTLHPCPLAPLTPQSRYFTGFLIKFKDVTKVIYPGLPEHPGYEIIKKQARGFGSMITFNVDTKEHALAILKKVKMIKFAESLGGVETLITYPTTQTHADVPEEVREKNGITACTLRLSTGIEDGEDLIAELETVFKNIDEID